MLLTRTSAKIAKDVIDANVGEDRKDVIDANVDEDRKDVIDANVGKTAKDFIEMKKQETPAQPQAVPDAVADFFPRPLKTAAQSKANERGTTLFPAFARNRRPAQPKADGFGAALFPTMKRAYLFRRVAPSPPN